MASPIEELFLPGVLPDGTPARVLPHGATAAVAGAMGISQRQAQIEALRLGIIPERYLRNFKTLDHAGQIRLLGTRVALAGMGGLGGPLLEGLARLGFGFIRAADPDVSEASNLNRQLLATQEALGRSKAEAARDRLAQVNPAVEAELAGVAVPPDGFAEFFRGADVALDALGGMDSRPAAEAGAREAGVPLVTAAVAGWTVMAATVMPGDPGPASLFASAKGGLCAEDTLGCLAPAIHVAVGIMLAETVRLALGKAPLLGGPTGSMAVMDLERMSLDRFSLGI